MRNIKKITIVMLILFIMATLLGCEKVFQVKRIENGNTKLPVTKQEAALAEEGKKVTKPESELPKKEKEEINNSEGQPSGDAPEDELLTDSTQVSTIEEESATEVTKETADDSPAVDAGVLSYLLITDSSGDAPPGLYQENYLVGEDHFVHLLAGIYYPQQKSLIVNISWQDYLGKIIYKEEKIEAPSLDNMLKIHSTLGLTKKVPGQDKLPDALGDYWVIIEINNKAVSKTKFSIVAE